MVVDESHADISEEDGVSEREEGATPRTSVLGHFANYRFTPRFWEMDAAGRRERARAWFEDVRAAADLAHPYLLQGIEEGADVMVWSTASADEGRRQRALLHAPGDGGGAGTGISSSP